MAGFNDGTYKTLLLEYAITDLKSAKIIISILKEQYPDLKYITVNYSVYRKIRDNELYPINIDDIQIRWARNP